MDRELREYLYTTGRSKIFSELNHYQPLLFPLDTSRACAMFCLARTTPKKAAFTTKLSISRQRMAL